MAGVSCAKQEFGGEDPPTGVLFKWSRVRLGDVIDGTSNTLMTGERPVSGTEPTGEWYRAVGQYGAGVGSAVFGAEEGALPDSNPAAGRFCADPIVYRYGSASPQCNNLHFWSYHPGGANFVFCDGSVRFLRYEARSVLPALATRASGEAVEVP